MAVWDPNTNFFTFFPYEVTHFCLGNEKLLVSNHKKNSYFSAQLSEKCFDQTINCSKGSELPVLDEDFSSKIASLKLSLKFSSEKT